MCVFNNNRDETTCFSYIEEVLEEKIDYTRNDVLCLFNMTVHVLHIFTYSSFSTDKQDHVFPLIINSFIFFSVMIFPGKHRGFTKLFTIFFLWMLHVNAYTCFYIWNSSHITYTQKGIYAVLRDISSSNKRVLFCWSSILSCYLFNSKFIRWNWMKFFFTLQQSRTFFKGNHRGLCIMIYGGRGG